MSTERESIPKASMEYIISQIRSSMELWCEKESFKYDNNRITYSYSRITHTFDDIISGGTVEVSFYTNNNSFEGHHNLFAVSFKGYIYGYSSRFDIYNDSYTIYS